MVIGLIKKTMRVKEKNMAKEIIKINAEERKSDFGSSGARRLVRKGQIPCVMYGQSTPKHFSISAQSFNAIRKKITKTTLIDLNLSGNEYECLLKDLQENLITDKIIHIDFYEIKRGKLLTARVKINFTGTAQGVREGGTLEQIMHEVEVECMPRFLPESIEVDVSSLKANEILTLADLPKIENVKYLDAENSTVATIRFTKAEAEGSQENKDEQTATGADNAGTESKK